MARLGFEVVEASRGKAVVVRTDHPLIKELRGIGSIDDAVEIVKRYLGE
jgi:stalled ribosome rescue protein Dom34